MPEPAVIVRQTTSPRVGPLAVALAAGAGCIGLALWNPGDDGTPICPTKALTDLDCPLCGGLRAVGSLGRGDLVRAADHNLVLVLMLPLTVAWWVAWWRADRRGAPAPRWRVPPAVWVAALGAVVAFTVARNVASGGAGAWLASDAS